MPGKKAKETESLLRRIDRLEKEVKELKKTVQEIRGKTLEKEEFPLSRRQPQKGVQPLFPKTPPKTPLKPSGQELKGERLELQIGKDWLNKAGILAIIFGTAFFLKYAFENQWIGVTGRIILGYLGGLFFLLAGEYLTSKFPRYAYVLSGGGIAILYLTTYAAFGYYSLFPAMMAFVLMTLITAATLALSVRYDALPLSLLGLLGGFLAPLLFFRGDFNLSTTIITLSYIAFLDLGILALAYFKKWPVLNLLSFLVTWFFLIGFLQSNYLFSSLKSGLLIELAYLTLFFLIFVANPALTALQSPGAYGKSEIFLLLFNPFLYFFNVYFLLEEKYSNYLGLYSLTLAILYFLFGYVLIKRDRKRVLSFPSLFFLGIGLTFATLTVPLQLSSEWVSLGWSVEAAILVWTGFRIRDLRVRASGLIVLAIALVNSLFFSFADPFAFLSGELSGVLYSLKSFRPLLNRDFLVTLSVVVATFYLAYLYSKNPVETSEKELGGFLVGLGIVFFFLAVNKEIALYFGSLRAKTPFALSGYLFQEKFEFGMQLAFSIWWTFYGALLVTVGFLKKYQLARYMGIFFLVLTVGKVFFYDMANLARLYRILSFIALGIVLLVISFAYQRFHYKLIKEENERKTR